LNHSVVVSDITPDPGFGSTRTDAQSAQLDASPLDIAEYETDGLGLYIGPGLQSLSVNLSVDGEVRANFSYKQTPPMPVKKQFYMSSRAASGGGYS